MTANEVRSYAVRASSTDIHGRVLCDARNHHFIVDGPVQNGAPGEEVTPMELFLASVAACGVELVQAFAKADSIPLRAINVDISGALDRANPVRKDFSVLNWMRLKIHMKGVSVAQGAALIDRFKGR